MKIPQFVSYLLPTIGAAGFFFFSELSLRNVPLFFFWSLVTMIWVLSVFALLAIGKLKDRLLAIAAPSILMIAISTMTSLLFLDLLASRHVFIVIFTLILYLFLEHVRREIIAPSKEDRQSIAEFARMVNIGSLFLLATVGIGITIFLPVPFWMVFLPFAVIAAVWSWHLFSACYCDCGRPVSRILLTALIVVETYIVVLQMPTSMFVGGALVGIVYYLAANLLRVGPGHVLSAKLIKRYIVVGTGLILLLLITARWV